MKRTNLICGLLALALAAHLSAVAAAQQVPADGESAEPSRTLANNSISIGASKPADTSAAVGDVDSEGDEAVAAQDGDDSPTPSREPAAQESLPLGGASSRAHAESAAGEQGEESANEAGWLNSFDPGESELLRVGGALFVVLGLLWLMRVFVKRAGLVTQSAGRPSGVLEVLARYPVGRRENLVLLKMHRRIVLVHQGDGRMSPLAEVSEPDEVAALLARVEEGSSGRHATRFKAMLNQFNAEYGQADERSSRRLPRLRRNTDDGDVVDLTRPAPGLGLLRVNRSA